MNASSCCLVSHTLRKGVGPADANRLLAAELARRGHRVSLCAIRDSDVSEVSEGEANVFGIFIPTFQIPEAMGWIERCELLGGYLEKHRPGHVIVRFIPYSLHPKGIVWSAANSLPHVLRGESVIWLMDEIWLGEGPATLRHRLVGAVQRLSILRLVKGVRPKRVYTNNRFNTTALRSRGVSAETLRLFGNIPVAPTDGGAWLSREYEEAGLPITPMNRLQWLVLGNFGLFHSDWNPDMFLAKLRDLAGRHGRQVCITGIGSLGSYEPHWRNVAKAWGKDFRFLHLGCRSESEVSRFLQSIDFGLTTNPYYLVGKSGTCMAMLDHGLPILVPRITRYDDVTEFPADLVLRCGDNAGDEIFQPRVSRAPNPQLPRAVDELVAAMSGG